MDNLAGAFRRAVAAHGERPALRFDESAVVSYAELDRVSNRVARFLRDHGVGAGDRVGICTDKSLVPYAVMLAAIKTGAVYFALDPANPPARLGEILRRCDPALVFAEGELAVDELADRVVSCGAWRRELPFAAPYGDGALEPPDVGPHDPVYVMFTSGSTGVPKGAVMSQRNVANFARWARQEYGFGPEAVHTAVNPLYFDNSVFDFYSTLFSGGTLVPFDAATMKSPGAVVERIRAMGCTVLFCVPSLLRFLQTMKLARRAELGTLDTVMFGGEGYPKGKLEDLFTELGGGARLVNVYGPTECTCICSSHVVDAADFDGDEPLVPLGELTAGFAGYLLDGDREVAPGEAGELCLGGPGVGLGYLGAPELTRAAFVENPVPDAPHARIYRTGDLVRQDPGGGLLHFVGRKDLQVKHQGHRIELEEIQHALAGLDGVDEAVALQRRDEAGSELVGVVAGRADALDGAALQKALRDLLPRYMIPAMIHVIDRMPKNANGKTDRRELARRYAGSAE